MATVTGFTAERMLDIENETVVSGQVDEAGDLILENRGGGTINAGRVVGPTGPTGAIVAFAGSVAPLGWAICDGSTFVRADNPELYAVIGTTYGAGDGTTTANLPNLKGRVIVGVDPSDADFGIADTGGEKEHTLTEAEMPVHTHIQNAHTHTQNAHNHTQNAHTHTQDAHNHTQNAHNHTQNSHSHDSRVSTRSDILAGGGTTTASRSNSDVGHTGGSTTATNQSTTATNNAATATNQSTTATNQSTTATNQNTTATNQNAGGGSAHNNLQPFLALNYIIKT